MHLSGRPARAGLPGRGRCAWNTPRAPTAAGLARAVVVRRTLGDGITVARCQYYFMAVRFTAKLYQESVWNGSSRFFHRLFEYTFHVKTASSHSQMCGIYLCLIFKSCAMYFFLLFSHCFVNRVRFSSVIFPKRLMHN